MDNFLQHTEYPDLERVRDAIEVLRKGGMILVRDDEGRENEGDLICAAQLADTESVAFMAVHGRGLICQSVTEDTARRLDLHPQTPVNRDSLGTAFTVSVDAAGGITTGISAADRAHTARIIATAASEPEELRRPGHLFPLVARKGGVFSRRGHTEASVDLTRLAGLAPSALICEVMKEDGSMARGEDLEAFAREWKLPLITVDEILAYREATGDLECTATPPARLPTGYGTFTLRVFRTEDSANGELALLEHPGTEKGKIGTPLVRLHSECLTGESFHSLRCDCGPQLDAALDRIAVEGGALVYLKQEGRGIGLFDKIRAYALQDEGLDTLSANLALGHQADARRYGAAAAVLKQAGYLRIRLMTNNPLKVAALERAGILVSARIGHHSERTGHNEGYLRTKIEKMGHFAPKNHEEIKV